MIPGKKGMMDDFFDVVFTVIALFFILFFLQVVLNSTLSEREEKSIEKINSFAVTETSFDYLHSPVFIDGKRTDMKNVILFAVNTEDSSLFQEKTNYYFEQNGLEGGVTVYNTNSYRSGQNGLFSSSTFFTGNVYRSVIELPNTENTEIPSVTIVMSVSS